MTMANMGKASTAVRKPKIKRAGILLRLKRDLTQARGIVIATQSTAASAAGIQATFICGGFFGFAYTKERNWAYFACGAKLPERKLKRGRAILYHVWRVLTWLDLLIGFTGKTRLYTIPAEQNLSKGHFWFFFGWRSIILPTIRFWGGYALGSKIEKWRMAALDVEQLCET